MKKFTLETLEITSFVVPSQPSKSQGVPQILNGATDGQEAECWSNDVQCADATTVDPQSECCGATAKPSCWDTIYFPPWNYNCGPGGPGDETSPETGGIDGACISDDFQECSGGPAECSEGVCYV